MLQFISKLTVCEPDGFGDIIEEMFLGMARTSLLAEYVQTFEGRSCSSHKISNDID